MTVQDLIDQLKEFDPDTMVRGTHGPELREITVYDDMYGYVVIDTGSCNLLR